MYSQQGSPYGGGYGYGYPNSQQMGGYTQQPQMPMQQQPQHMQHMQNMPQMPQSSLPGTPMPPPPQFVQEQQKTDMDDVPQEMLPIEMSYIENILRLNRQRVGTFYMTYENNEKWNAKIFKGVIEAAGRDHIIISDPQTEKRYLLLMVNLDYVTFDEEIDYDYPYNGLPPGQALGSYPPR